VVADAWEMEGHTQASGAVLRWFRDEFGGAQSLVQAGPGRDAYDLLVDEACQSPAGSEDLIFLPTFNGSTAPVVDPHARGALIGLRLSHGRSHVIRALLEGISLEIRSMLEAISAAGAAVDEVRLAGGGSRNGRWNQIHADILDHPVTTVANPEAALVGAAMCAAVGMGIVDDFQAAAKAFVRLGETLHPRAENRRVYDKAYERYVQTFSLLSEGKAFLA
jgi:xylulokinase